jgi:asparagine synthase (glutamine-hydrolysing)
MCGIAGWLDGAPRPEAHLVAMANSMAHRGPDDRGVLYDAEAGVALAHNRLSIIDLSAAGHEPMFNEDGAVALVFNGEIYNFEALREQLVAAGHRFVSRTDCEVVVHGYEEWGAAVVERLEGMFAFALWDARTQRLFLARDPMGIKPLYYWLSASGGLYFASEIKAFLSLPDFHAEANPRAIRQFLELNFVYDVHESSLRGVWKLPAGHTLTVERARTGEAPAPRRYFTPPAPSTEEIDEDAWTERLHAVLEQVVDQHLVADVPVALLLSGGLDSGIIAALAARRRPIRTITMAFADSQVDERAFARTLSRHLGSQHEEIVIRPAEVVAEVGRAAWYVDDLFGDWGLFSTLVLYRRCREAGAKVVLVGEGSDELFGGYTSYTSAGGPDADGSSLLRRGLQLYRWYSGRRWGRELVPFLRTIASLHDEFGGDFFSTIRYFESRHQLPHNYNMKVDKASMAASVEARVPFLDVRVARLAYSVPRSLLLRNGSNKYLLRRVAERYGLLPPELVERPKYGASIAASWMDEDPGFRAFAREVVLDGSGWVDHLGLRRPMEDYFDGRRQGYGFPHGLSIFSILAWRLLLLNLWSRHYLAAPARAA